MTHPLSKKILFMDTAMNSCGVAVHDGENVFSSCEALSRGQAEKLVPHIDRVMQEANMGFDQLDAIAVTVGPGTFTGLRVGMACAKGFGLSLDLPVIGLSTLEILAAQNAKNVEKEQMAILIESKRSDFYIQIFDKDAHALSDPQAIEAKDIKAQYADRDVCFFGDALQRFDEAIRQEGGEGLPTNWNLGDMKPQVPMPEVAVLLAQKHVKKYEEDNQNIPDIDPIYLKGANVSKPKIQRMIADK